MAGLKVTAVHGDEDLAFLHSIAGPRGDLNVDEELSWLTGRFNNQADAGGY